MIDFKRAAFQGTALTLLVLLTFSFWAVCAEGLRLWSLRAEVMPFVVAYIAIFFGKEWGAGFGCFAGILVDAASGKTAGYYTLYLMIAAILVGIVSERYFRTHFLASVASGYLVYLLGNLIRMLVVLVIPGKASFSVFFTYFMPAGLYSLLWSIPLYLVLRRFYRRFEL